MQHSKGVIFYNDNSVWIFSTPLAVVPVEVLKKPSQDLDGANNIKLFFYVIDSAVKKARSFVPHNIF